MLLPFCWRQQYGPQTGLSLALRSVRLRDEFAMASAAGYPRRHRDDFEFLPVARQRLPRFQVVEPAKRGFGVVVGQIRDVRLHEVRRAARRAMPRKRGPQFDALH
ncbi:hypothetical protein [Crateriforma conspicua]|uniref:hypothetical protein n=1 Tax=Crateriforma conspicua TaxID=2527996 RepID=UPI0018CD5449|nr:hypothetical protein [Crateriforma conspicua]